MGSNPVGDASGGQRQGRGDRRQKEERTDLAQRYRVVPDEVSLKRWALSLLFRGILQMPFFNNQQAEIQEFKKHKASWYF